MRGSARKVLVSAACVLGLAATAAPVLTLAAASPAAAAAPSSAAGSGLPTPGIYHAPILGKVVTSVLGQLLGGNSVRHATDVTSSNWSGYADGNDTYNSVAASWTEPTVNCGSSGGGGGILGGLLGGEGLGDLIGPSGSAGSFWVGIDGYTSSSVEQLGTDADCNGSTPDYYAWWEMYPNPSDVITTSSAYPVHPGDQITAWVASNSSGTKFYLSEKDVTAGWTFSTTQTAPAVSPARRPRSWPRRRRRATCCSAVRCPCRTSARSPSAAPTSSTTPGTTARSRPSRPTRSRWRRTARRSPCRATSAPTEDRSRSPGRTLKDPCRSVHAHLTVKALSQHPPLSRRAASTRVGGLFRGPPAEGTGPGLTKRADECDQTSSGPA